MFAVIIGLCILCNFDAREKVLGEFSTAFGDFIESYWIHTQDLLSFNPFLKKASSDRDGPTTKKLLSSRYRLRLKG